MYEFLVDMVYLIEAVHESNQTAMQIFNDTYYNTYLAWDTADSEIKMAFFINVSHQHNDMVMG